MLAGLVIAIILGGAGFLFVRSRKGHDLWTSGIAGRAFELVMDSPQAREALGTPIRQTGPAEGQARLLKVEGYVVGGYAEAAVPVAGPKAAGKVYVVANQDSSGWQMEAVELVLDGSGKTLDLTPPLKTSRLLPHLRGRGEIDLLPLGTEEAELLQPLPAYYKARLGIDVKILPAGRPDPSVLSGLRRKVVAERLVEWLERSNEPAGTEPRTLIAVTARPMEIEAFGVTDAVNYWREDGFAVVSLAPLQPRGRVEAGNPLILPVRLRKAVTRDIGRLYYGFPLSSDPTSVLFSGFSDAQAVDLMGESFLSANGEWAPGWMGLDPCVSIIHQPDGNSVWRLQCVGTPPDTRAEVWENNLRLGLFDQEQTDFDFGEPFPLARMYRPRDNQNRAFGIGTNHTLDIFLVGEMEHWVDLIGANGSRERFRRNWWKFYDEEYVEPAGGSGLVSPVLRWNDGPAGWSLKLPNGWTMIFPSSHDARRSQQSALTGIIDDRGRHYQFQRDAEGNLLHLATPDGYAIDFCYDDHQRVIQASDNRARIVHYTYDIGGRLIHVEDSAGRSENYSYDAHDQMIQIRDAAGRTLLTNEYDEAGWLVRQKLPDGRIFQYRYNRDPEGNLRSAEFLDPGGCSNSFRFSSGGYWQWLPKCPENQSPAAPAPRSPTARDKSSRGRVR